MGGEVCRGKKKEVLQLKLKKRKERTLIFNSFWSGLKCRMRVLNEGGKANTQNCRNLKSEGPPGGKGG